MKCIINKDSICSNCGTRDNLTRHHLKVKDGTKSGKRTGVVYILCRDCHDLAEIEYGKKGIVKNGFMSKKFKPVNLYMFGIFQMRNPIYRNIFLLKMKCNRYKKMNHQYMCFQASKMKKIQEWQITNKHENRIIQNMKF